MHNLCSFGTATHFTFMIDTANRNSFSDGFAFFLAPVGYPVPVNSAGGVLGLFNSTTCFNQQSEIQILVVELIPIKTPEILLNPLLGSTSIKSPQLLLPAGILAAKNQGRWLMH